MGAFQAMLQPRTIWILSFVSLQVYWIVTLGRTLREPGLHPLQTSVSLYTKKLPSLLIPPAVAASLESIPWAMTEFRHWMFIGHTISRCRLANSVKTSCMQHQAANCSQSTRSSMRRILKNNAKSARVLEAAGGEAEAEEGADLLLDVRQRTENRTLIEIKSNSEMSHQKTNFARISERFGPLSFSPLLCRPQGNCLCPLSLCAMPYVL